MVIAHVGGGQQAMAHRDGAARRRMSYNG
jgi:hypothetical protein